MRALVVELPGHACLREVAMPQPGPGEVLVRVAAAGICGSDLELLHGSRPAAYVRYPVVPGHEWAGTMAALGPGVTGLAAGDAVVAEGFRSCGVCERCREGRSNLCSAEYAETGFTHAGAFAEFVCVPARLVHRLLEAQLRPGLRVAVVGAGTLGLLAVAILSLTSPSRLALHRFPLERFDAAFDALEDRHRGAVKVELVPALGPG